MSSCNKFTFLSFVYWFASTSNLFKYLKLRYSHQLVQDLNYVIRLKGKCVRSKEGIKFLRDCLDYHVTPSYIKKRVLRTKPKNPGGIEKAFLRDDLEKRRDFFRLVSEEYPWKLIKVCRQLSYLDRLRFCKLLNQTAERLQDQTRTKNGKTLQWLIKRQLGQGVLRYSTIVNLADIELSEAEKNVLCRGLDFGIPPHLSPEMIAAEFELCWQQLERAVPASKQREEECRAGMAHLAQRYANAEIDRTGFSLGKEHLHAIRELKRRKDVVITRPDKGNGVVILKREDYVEKMNAILSQADKFEKIGSVESSDNTLQQERALQAFLLRARKNGHISKEVYERIRPVGASRPRMYGLPKLHKQGVPMRPILSMVNAPQQEMARWLAGLLRPVVMKYGDRTLKDTFEFCDDLERFVTDNNVEGTFMCSFDISSLFTNVPLNEAIDIALDALYRDPEVPTPSEPESLIRKMLLKATTDVEFSFDGNMYKQLDGVAMGSPLGPILANIFVGFLESRIDEDQWPLLYRRFVDDAFSVFPCEESALQFFGVLNRMHPALRFTMENEVDSRLPFMDVLVRRTSGGLVRSVYRKPTFTGLYIRWDSFSPTHQKIGLIKSLASRARKICSETTLREELDRLQEIFLDNGYPMEVIEKHLRVDKPVTTKPADQSESGDTAFLQLPWIGRQSMRFRTEIADVITKAFPKVKPMVVFTTSKAFSGREKDVLPTTSRSSIIYEFTCRCDRTYVGKTIQLLGERIKQHIPDRLFMSLRQKSLVKSSSDSAITKHLADHSECVYGKAEMRTRFRVLASARHSQHLDVLEALFIRSRCPELCQQKNNLRKLKLVS